MGVAGGSIATVFDRTVVVAAIEGVVGCSGFVKVVVVEVECSGSDVFVDKAVEGIGVFIAVHGTKADGDCVFGTIFEENTEDTDEVSATIGDVIEGIDVDETVELTDVVLGGADEKNDKNNGLVVAIFVDVVEDREILDIVGEETKVVAAFVVKATKLAEDAFATVLEEGT